MPHTVRLLVSVLVVAAGWLLGQADEPEVRVASVETNGLVSAEYRSAGQRIWSSSVSAPAGVELLLPGGRWMPVEFRTRSEHAEGFELGPTQLGALTLRWRLTQKTPQLVERTLEVTAEAAQRFAVSFLLEAALDGEFASFTGPEKARVLCDTVRGSPRTETFPVDAAIDRRLGVAREGGTLRLLRSPRQTRQDPPPRRSPLRGERVAEPGEGDRFMVAGPGRQAKVPPHEP